MSQEPLPYTHMGLFLTENCNLRCQYCFASSMEGKNISQETAEKALELLLELSGDSKKVSITFWGGEPFLRFPMMQNLVGLAKSKAAATGKEVSFSVPTNATLLTEELLGYCIAEDLSLSLSLDGDSDSQSLRKFATGGSSFLKILEQLPLILDKLGPFTPVRMTVNAEKVHNLHNDVDFFVAMGFRDVRFYPAWEGDWTEARIREYRAQLEKVGANYVQFFSRDWEDAIPSLRSFEDVFKRLAAQAATPPGEQAGTPAKLQFCGAGRKMFTVAISGELFPCHRFVFYDRPRRRYRIGHVSEGLTEKAILCEFAEVCRERVHSGETRCLDCSTSDTCGYLCVAHNYDYSQDIYSVHPNVCKLIRHLHTVAREVFEQLKENRTFAEHMRAVALRKPPGLEERLQQCVSAGTWEETVDEITNRAWGYLSGDRE